MTHFELESFEKMEADDKAERKAMLRELLSMPPGSPRPRQETPAGKALYAATSRHQTLVAEFDIIEKPRDAIELETEDDKEDDLAMLEQFIRELVKIDYDALENRVRRKAKRLELRLEKSRRRNTRALDYGTYSLIDGPAPTKGRTNWRSRISVLGPEYGVSLAEVCHFFDMRVA